MVLIVMPPLVVQHDDAELDCFDYSFLLLSVVAAFLFCNDERSYFQSVASVIYYSRFWFLDGVDELLDAKNASVNTWIPAHLAANVKIVFSQTTDSTSTETLKTFASIVHIGLMDVLTTDEVLHKWLRSANRTLTSCNTSLSSGHSRAK